MDAFFSNVLSVAHLRYPHLFLSSLRAPAFLPNSVNEILFSSHILYAILILIFGALLFRFGPTQYQKITRKTGLLFIFAAVLWSILFLIVDSPSERLSQRHQQIIDAVTKADSTSITNMLAPDFHFAGSDRQLMSEQIKSVLSTFKFESNVLRLYEANISQQDAQTTIRVMTKLAPSSIISAPGPYVTRWDLTWHDDPNSDWQLVAINRWYTWDGQKDTPMPDTLP